MTEEIKKEETKEEAATPAKEADKEVEVPSKFKDIVEKVESMSVLELSELVKVLEEKFGVSAQAMAMAMPAGATATGGDDAADEDAPKNVELKTAGDQKIQVIKVIKEVLGLGLKDAKDMVDGAPVVVKEGVKSEEAEELKAKFEEAGATVEVK